MDGSTLTVTYSETLDGASIPGLDTFKISVDGSDRVVQRVSIDGSQVTLTLASDVAAGDGVMLSYTEPLSMDLSRIQDAVGNAASSLGNKTVTNNT